MGATRASRWSAGIVTAAVVSDCCCGPGVAQRIALPGSSKAAQVTATQPRISFARFPVRIAFGFISSLRFGFSLLNVALFACIFLREHDHFPLADGRKSLQDASSELH